MLEIGKQTNDQFLITVKTEGHSIPVLISRFELLSFWNRIAELIVEEK